MKYLLWALLLYLGWRWYLGKTAKSSSPSPEAAATTQKASGSGAPTEKMVACAYCGTHLPLSESVQGADELHFCSDSHRSLHAGR